LIKSFKLNPSLITPTGKKNRIMKGDVLKYIEDNKNKLNGKNNLINSLRK